MANIDYNDYGVAAALSQLAGAQQQMAMRPQKSVVKTFTTTANTPRALEDMIARRNMIGANNANLLNALKPRESFGYNIGAGLADLVPVQGYGDWGVNALRAFGGAVNRPTDATIARAQAERQMANEDLKTALEFDKAMGQEQSQAQEQSIKYDELPYAGGTGAGKTGGSSAVPITTKFDWDYWIKNWDADRPTEKDYRSQSALGRRLSNFGVGPSSGTATENAARKDFDTFVGKDILMIARDSLRGTGPITDFEDKKYTQWINESKQDPVALKDTFVRMVQDVANKNGWNNEQKRQAYEILGLTSNANDLLPAQIEQDPMRVRQNNAVVQPTEQPATSNVEDILKKHGAKRVQ